MEICTNSTTRVFFFLSLPPWVFSPKVLSSSLFSGFSFFFPPSFPVFLLFACFSFFFFGGLCFLFPFFCFFVFLWFCLCLFLFGFFLYFVFGVFVWGWLWVFLRVVVVWVWGGGFFVFRFGGVLDGLFLFCFLGGWGGVLKVSLGWRGLLRGWGGLGLFVFLKKGGGGFLMGNCC